MLEHARQPDVGFRKLEREAETEWQNPDDCSAFAVEEQSLADDAFITRKMAAPKAIAQDGDIRSAGLLLLGKKSPAARGGNIEHAKKDHGNVRALNGLGLLRCQQAGAERIIGGDAFERLSLVVNLREFGKRTRDRKSVV